MLSGSVASSTGVGAVPVGLVGMVVGTSVGTAVGTAAVGTEVAGAPVGALWVGAALGTDTLGLVAASEGTAVGMLPCTAVVAGSGSAACSPRSAIVPAGLVGFACGTSGDVAASDAAVVGRASLDEDSSAARTPVVASTVGDVGRREGVAVLPGTGPGGVVADGEGLAVGVAVGVGVGADASAGSRASSPVWPTAWSHGDVVSGFGGSSALTGRSTGGVRAAVAATWASYVTRSIPVSLAAWATGPPTASGFAAR